MDNPANPVFFNTFDPFDNPTPPPNPITKSSSLTNSSSLQAPAHHDVNTTNVLQPSTANVNSNNNYPYLPSPLDSPSINPYPLPRSSFAPSPSPSPASSSPVPPAYSSNSSSLSNSYSVPSTNSSSVPKTSPLGSPSLTSQSNGYPQFQAPSPVPPSYGTTSPIPNQSQPVQFHQAPSPAPPPYGSASPIPNQSQPRAPSPVAQSYGTTSPIPSSQSMYDSNPGMKYFQPPSSQVTQTSPPQPTPPTQSQSTQPSFSLTTTSQSPTLGPQKDILEQMNKSLNAVMTRLDSIENRLSFLEITTKEVLNNQRTISTQQRKLQDSVDTTKMPAPVPQHIHQHVYEEPRKAQVPAYPQPPLQPPPTHSHISPPVIMPPPTSHSHMPALVPVTHIADRGAMDYKPSMASRGGPSQYDADLELAKKLQAEFDSSSSSSSSSTPSSSSSSNANSSSMSSSYSSKPISQPSSSSSQSKSGHQECPICQTRVALADLEAHVEQHFEDDEAKRAPPKPGEKQMSKSEAKAGFFAKLFGPKPEDEKKPSTEQATPAPAATPSPAAAAQVPYTHTMNPAYNQRMGYYAAPGMPAASPGRAMYAAPYYGYPVQNVPRSAAAQPQQFLYYPNLDQNPQ